MSHSDPAAAARLVRELYSSRADGRYRELVDALVALGSPAVPELIRALKAPPLRGWAAFLAFLFGYTGPANEAVVTALARIGDPRAVDTLGAALATANVGLALHLVRELGEMNLPGTIPILRHAVTRYHEDGEGWNPVRVLAARTLVQLRDHTDLPALLCSLPHLPATDAGLPEGSYQGPSQEGVVARIVATGDPAVITPLLYRERGAYVSAPQVARFGLAALPQLLRALDPGALARWEPLDPDKALEVLVLLGPEAAPALRSHLRGNSRPAASRCSIALCLLGYPEKELIEPVLRAVEQDWSTELAIAALERLVDTTRDPALRRALPLLRKRLWTAALTAEARASHQELIARIESETVDLRSVPLPASAPSGPAHDLPIASRPAD